MTLRLAPLTCPTCQAPLNGGDTDLLFFCPCGRGIEWTSDGLQSVSAAAFAIPNGRAANWSPAWEVLAEVTLTERRTANSGSFVGGLIAGLAASRATGPQPVQRRYVVPARPIPIAELLARTRSSLSWPIADQPLPVAAIAAGALGGGTLSRDEAAALARTAAFAEEVAQRDTLSALAVHLLPIEFRLLAVSV